MAPVAEPTGGDAARLPAVEDWQALLDRHPEMFAGLRPGARIAILATDDFDSPDAHMQVWEAGAEDMTAGYRPFPGFETVDVDLLFIVEDDFIRRLGDPTNPTPFAEMKARVRRREILLFVIKPREALLDAGYDEFLNVLDLTFMGACR